MKKIMLAIVLATGAAQPVAAAMPIVLPAIRLEVWSHQRFDDPFSSDELVEIFFRSDAGAYLTIYQINPWGGVDIIYPRPHHRWVAILPHRVYCLSDLAADLYLDYEGVEGHAHLGFIATHEPVDLLPWLESGFHRYGLVFGRPGYCRPSLEVSVALGHIEADLRFRLGNHCRPAFFTRMIHLRPRYREPRAVVYRRSRPEIEIGGKWNTYRPSSPAPPAYSKRFPDIRYRAVSPPEDKRRTVIRAPESPKRQESKDLRRQRKPKN
jgi:hypothetical protein